MQNNKRCKVGNGKCRIQHSLAILWPIVKISQYLVFLNFAVLSVLESSSCLWPQATAGVSGPEWLWISGPAGPDERLEHTALPQDAGAGGKSLHSGVLLPRLHCGQSPTALLPWCLMDLPWGKTWFSGSGQDKWWDCGLCCQSVYLSPLNVVSSFFLICKVTVYRNHNHFHFHRSDSGPGIRHSKRGQDEGNPRPIDESGWGHTRLPCCDLQLFYHIWVP